MSKAVLIAESNKSVGGIKEDIRLSPNEKKDGAIRFLSRFLRLDGLGKRHGTAESPTTGELPITYYGVYIPCEIKKGPDEEVLHVYENKSEALELVKRYKSSRFKAFRNHQDAVSFALRGAEPEVHEGNGNSLMGEKPYPFKAPSPQDMVALRKAIEAGLTSKVRDRVWDNPRYLVSSGNTPAIVQEGARYNALHVAAKAMNAEICNLILTTVGNPSFVQKLYGVDADIDSCKDFAAILVDRYLNTPDKALNETPLHFAAKFGAEQAVDVLTSFSQCNKSSRNKHGESPLDIICSRAKDEYKNVKDSIRAALSERYYVPVLHSDDGSAPPSIGQPFTPSEPPELNRDPLSPRLEIRAYAGPMPAAAARALRRRWKTPPRAPRPPPFRLGAKGLEAMGRNLAEEMKIGWKEYWPFLDTFTDLRSLEGLDLLEQYLKKKYDSACSLLYSESFNQTNHSPGDLSISGISLHTPQTPTEMSPMSELCLAMRSCNLIDRPKHYRNIDPARQRLCRQPIAKQTYNGESAPTINHTINQLLCIERTCQVFAKRIADALVFSLTAEPEIAGESLKSEAKHLQHTMYTYMDDERFQMIDFALIHSRLAQLVVFKLNQQTKDADDIQSLIEFLMKLRCPNDDIFSSDDERKPFSYRTNRIKAFHILDAHVRCLVSFISEELSEIDVMKGPATSESECTVIWNKASKCCCDWKIEMFERNSKKNASLRKNRSILSTSPKIESVIRRISFDHDIGDGKSHTKEIEKPMSVNSPGGDNAPDVISVDVAKCRVVEPQITEDESSPSSDDDAYITANEDGIEDSDDNTPDAMEDASDRALAEPFIYGEEPTKMDRLVYEALVDCSIPPDKYPNVFRWKHTIALYSTSDMNSWQPTTGAIESHCSIRWVPDDVVPLASPRIDPGVSPRSSTRPRPRCSTPNRDNREDASRTLPLQVSTWLRVTGPNSPRSALASKNVTHNVSFGF